MKVHSRHVRPAASAAASALVLAAVLAACGGGTSPNGRAAASPSPTTTTPLGTGAGHTGGGSFQGATGSVAAITGSSMEVQDPSTGQTTVDWTGSTTFDHTVTLSADSLTPGSCVTVTGSPSNGTITARSVTIAPAASSGGCTNGFAGARRAFPGGSPGTRPTGTAPNGAGTGGRGLNRGAGGSFAAGKVMSSSATSLVLLGTSFDGFGGGARPSTPPTTSAPTDITVTLTPSTTFTEVQPTTSSSLAVGDCVVATGPADSTGAVTARTVRITSSGGRTCSVGSGRFPGAPAPASTTNG